MIEAMSMSQHPPPKPFPDWMPRKLAARFLQAIGCPISYKTLERMAERSHKRKGPPYNVVYDRIFYGKADLEAWAKKVTVRVE